jgi:hypothetical protein
MQHSEAGLAAAAAAAVSDAEAASFLIVRRQRVRAAQAVIVTGVAEGGVQ